MIITSILFIFSFLILYSKKKQSNYIFYSISIILLSLYFFSAEYSVDYPNLKDTWDNYAALDSLWIPISGEFVYYYLNSFLSKIFGVYVSLPITILILSLTSTFIISNTFSKSKAQILSSFILPFNFFLAFISLRQSLACSFMLLSISFLFGENHSLSNKLKVFF